MRASRRDVCNWIKSSNVSTRLAATTNEIKLWLQKYCRVWNSKFTHSSLTPHSVDLHHDVISILSIIFQMKTCVNITALPLQLMLHGGILMVNGSYSGMVDATSPLWSPTRSWHNTTITTTIAITITGYWPGWIRATVGSAACSLGLDTSDDQF